VVFPEHQYNLKGSGRFALGPALRFQQINFLSKYNYMAQENAQSFEGENLP